MDWKTIEPLCNNGLKSIGLSSLHFCEIKYSMLSMMLRGPALAYHKVG